MNSIEGETEFDFIKMVSDAQKECNDIKNKLEEKINSKNKLEILSRISLLTQTRPNGTSYSEYYGTLSDTACMPFIVGLSLKKETICGLEPSFEDIEDILNLLDSYFNKYGLSLHPISKNSDNREDIIYSARIHGLIGQINPEKYPFQILELLRKTFGHLDDYFKKKYGFTVNDAIFFGQLIEDHYVNNVNQRKRGVQKEELKEEEKSRIFYSKIREIIEISPEKFCEDNHIEDPETFGKYLSTLSCNFGEGNEKYDSPLDDNLIFNKPLIHNKGKYYSFIPLDLIQKLPSIFEDLLYKEKIANSKNWQRYKETKSKYTETKVHEGISKIFPERDIFRNLFYKYNGTPFEVDHIIQYCNNVIVIESKSGNFSLSAKRGGLERIKTDLKRLVCDAHSQALRVKDFIISRKSAEFKDSSKNVVLKIEYKENDTNFILINVTLEPLHSFSSNLKRLENLGIFSKYDYPWSVSLFELEIITKFLNSPAIFIHYIERRLKAQEQNNFSTYDELSFLGLYLEKGNFDFSTKNGKKLDMISLNPEFLADFDNHYLLGKEAPQLKIEKEIRTIITELEKLRPDNFTKITNVLLDLNHESRTNFIMCLKKVISDTQIDGRRHDFSFVVEPKKIGITVFSQVGRENLLNHLASFCELKKYQIKSDSWIGLGIDILDSDYFVNEYYFDDEKWRKEPRKEKLLKWVYDNKILRPNPDFILK